MEGVDMKQVQELQIWRQPEEQELYIADQRAIVQAHSLQYNRLDKCNV